MPTNPSPLTPRQEKMFFGLGYYSVRTLIHMSPVLAVVDIAGNIMIDNVAKRGFSELEEMLKQQ